MTTAIKKALAQLTKAVNAQKNPAKRKGTVSPKRKSQVTKKAPTKRLVARRKANTKKGYFPNPSEIKKAHANDCIYVVQQESSQDKWETVAKFKMKTKAVEYAHELAKNKVGRVRVMKE